MKDSTIIELHKLIQTTIRTNILLVLTHTENNETKRLL